MRVCQSRLFRYLRTSMLVVACCVAALTLGAEPRAAVKPHESVTKGRYALVYKRSKTIHAVYTYEVHAPNMTADFWELFVANPPQLPSQFEVKARLIPNGQDGRELSSLGRSVLVSRFKVTEPGQKHKVSARMEIDATLISRHLVAREEAPKHHGPEHLSPADRNKYLLSNAMLDFNTAEFKAWLSEHKLHRRTGEEDVDLARRVFLQISRNFKYEYLNKMDRAASHICAEGRSDCGGLSGVFVAGMRANGIPARLLAGRWARSSEPGKLVGEVEYFQQHVKAEFYAQDVGWIPVDLSSAVQHNHTQAGLKYFGHDAGDFVTMHVDVDLELETSKFGRKTTRWLQGVHYWVHGEGKLDNVTQTRNWRVEVE
jgi:transglutaminase-like putative cysteine protease